jgi:drug/metabolite transporter superfamily protein YnfA
MVYRILADAVVLVHLLFVVFVVLGGFLVWRWSRVAWVHVPAAVWGATIEYAGWICPLTPLENACRARAGLAGYRGGFVEHYLIPLLYPAGLTPRAQTVLGTVVVAVNVLAYGVVIRRMRRGA